MARAILDADYRPPVAQGDVLKALATSPRVIAIIDGFFEIVPSVWHKEILIAMEEGVHVFGASSMGALRAAELDRFGMVGIGEVYKWYRDGIIEDDDEVALLHLDANKNFAPVTLPMVDIRDVLEGARAKGVIGNNCVAIVGKCAKELHFSERTWPSIIRRAAKLGITEDEIENLQNFISDHKVGIKQRDAVALLQHVADFMAREPQPKEIDYLVERTVFLEQLEQEVALQRSVLASDGTLSSVEEGRKDVLIRLLARRVAASLGIGVDEIEMSHALTAFQNDRASFTKGQQYEAWLRENGLHEAEILEFLIDQRLIAGVTHQLRFAIEEQLPGHIRLTSLKGD